MLSSPSNVLYVATLLTDVGKGSHTVSVELIFSSLSEDAALSVDQHT